MKFSKKLKVAIPVMALAVSMVPFSAFANETDENPNVPAVMEEKRKVTYSEFKGSVTDVRENTFGKIYIRVEEGEQMYDFSVGDNTILVTAEGVKPIAEIEVGDKITVYYIQPMVNILIFPPQMEATVFVKEPAVETGSSIFVGRFDENLVSDNNFLKINAGSEKTKIVNSKGEAVDEEIAGKDLAVVFSIMTMSIPAQTNPELVVILDTEREAEETGTPEGATGQIGIVNEPLKLTDEDKAKHAEGVVASITDTKITVMGNETEAPAPYALDGYVMLPLRAIAEAAGFDVNWNGEIGAITVGRAINLKVGEDYYTFAKMAPITLGQAPVIKDGNTYVPMSFFTEVMNLEVVIADGHITLNEVQISE
ncbi:copper amine oxidase N-terminal domain-containing protein [Tyzzerella sp. OttesenSCG-928-J15]|nr:copper amine oxidase N-terminal domain-containing protein [Tyzzerella sp. OttesenSCG-928-J15]